MSESGEARDQLRADHTEDAIRARLAGRRQGHLRDFVYGAVDGTVTTFAVVADSPARARRAVVVVLGVANLLADGFSMGASNYLGARAERQEHGSASGAWRSGTSTRWPEGEREEVRQIFAAKGFEGADLDREWST